CSISCSAPFNTALQLPLPPPSSPPLPSSAFSSPGLASPQAGDYPSPSQELPLSRPLTCALEACFASVRSHNECTTLPQTVQHTGSVVWLLEQISAVQKFQARTKRGKCFPDNCGYVKLQLLYDSGVNL
ncbi:hypothetical protein Vretimale_10164, partial [Volvox reticuliferus]